VRSRSSQPGSQHASSPQASSQLSLRQTTLTSNASNTQDVISKLEIQERQARVRAMELENERAELELVKLRRELQDSV
jgi:hypothetical protein